MPDTITASNAITIEDVEYQKGMLARLYRPKGTGPFPAALQVHGGAWTSKDRTDNDFMFDWKWRYDHAKPEASLKLVRRLTGIVAEAHDLYF